MSAIPQDDDLLLAQCEVHVFRSSGPGGQHVNRRETAVRLRHLPTGVVTVSRQERSQHRNRAIALRQLRRKLEHRFAKRKARLPTSIPRRTQRRRIENKKRQGLKKTLRRPPSSDD